MNVELVEKAQSNKGVQVISRAADILRALKNEHKGLSLGQIADRVGLPRSTVQRIVNALQAERFVMASSAEGGFRLGPELQSLAEAGRIDIAEMIRPLLSALARETGETVDLAVYRQDHMMFVDQVIGTHRLRTVSAVGEAFPLSNTANGKAALAMLGDDAAASLIAREQKATPKPRRPLSDVIRGGGGGGGGGRTGPHRPCCLRHQRAYRWDIGRWCGLPGPERTDLRDLHTCPVAPIRRQKGQAAASTAVDFG